MINDVIFSSIPYPSGSAANTPAFLLYSVNGLWRVIMLHKKGLSLLIPTLAHADNAA